MSNNAELNVKQGITKLRKVFISVLITSWVISFYVYLLGYNFFELPERWISEHMWVNNIIQTCMFMINSFFGLSICLDIYDKRVIKHIFILTGIHLLLTSLCFLLAVNVQIISALPLVYIVILLIAERDKTERKYKLIRTAFFMFTYVYSVFSVPIKTGIFSFGYVEVTTLELLYFSVDLYVVCALIYSMKGGKIDERINRKLGRTDSSRDVLHSRFLVYTEQAFQYRTSRDEDCEIEDIKTEFDKLSSRKRHAVTLSFLAIHLTQIIVVYGVVSLISNRAVTSAILFILFWVFGSIIKMRWHSEEGISNCSVASAVSFYITLVFTLPLQYSIFSISVSAFFLVYALYRIAMLTEAKKELEYIKKGQKNNE